MQGDRHAVLEREPPMPGDVIGVSMGLEHPHDAEARVSSRFEVLLDRVRGIDDDGYAGVLVADEIRSASEGVVDELLEEHNCDASNECGYIS